MHIICHCGLRRGDHLVSSPRAPPETGTSRRVSRNASLSLLSPLLTRAPVTRLPHPSRAVEVRAVLYTPGD